jgi:putative hydrolase of HD superfamily
MKDRLFRQLDFIREIDKVKTIIRNSTLFCENRKENDAEHSWHICIMTMVLAEYTKDAFDPLRVMKMLLIHDLVEIDAGDIVVYNKTALNEEAERKAADRIFGILPLDQAKEFRVLWDEFEEKKTPDSRFAAAMDRLEPMLMNLAHKGEIWEKYGIRYEQVIQANKIISEVAPEIWGWLENVLYEHPYWTGKRQETGNA